MATPSARSRSVSASCDTSRATWRSPARLGVVRHSDDHSIIRRSLDEAKADGLTRTLCPVTLVRIPATNQADPGSGPRRELILIVGLGRRVCHIQLREAYALYDHVCDGSVVR